MFGFTVAKAVDQNDCVNSSNTYGFIAEVMAVEVDPDTAAIKILRYATVHDAGTIINPMIAEGQIYGGALHGLGGALFEELLYDERRPVPDRIVHGLSGADGHGGAGDRHRPRRLALAADAARLQGARRIELDDRPRRDRECRERCARSARQYGSPSCR